MRENRPVRLIRKRQPESGNESSDRVVRTEPSEREIKTVVSSWVRDHRQRSEEFKRTFAAMLGAGEFQLPTS
jgi:hypothetical protein